MSHFRAGRPIFSGGLALALAILVFAVCSLFRGHDVDDVMRSAATGHSCVTVVAASPVSVALGVRVPTGWLGFDAPTGLYAATLTLLDPPPKLVRPIV